MLTDVLAVSSCAGGWCGVRADSDLCCSHSFGTSARAVGSGVHAKQYIANLSRVLLLTVPNAYILVRLGAAIGCTGHYDER